MTMDRLRYIFARGSEASTYAGLGVILALTGINVEPSVWQAGIHAATALCGFLAVVLREKRA